MDRNSNPNKTLFVGGIPWESTEDEIRTAFEEAGAVVSVNILTDRMTGKSRGFGFVEMETIEAAQAAIDRWDGKMLGRRPLSVSFKNTDGGTRAPRRDGDRGGDRGGDRRPQGGDRPTYDSGFGGY